MNTIQKAFIFVVLVLAVLVATTTLVLFAQRTNWKGQAAETEKTLADTKAQLAGSQKDLASARDASAAKSLELESKVAALTTELANTKRDLESTMADKSQMTTLATAISQKMEIMSKDMSVLSQRTAELQLAKEAAEAKLEEVRTAAMSAEENLIIAERKVKDYEAKIASLTDQLSARDDQIKKYEQQVAAMAPFAPPVSPQLTAPPKHPVFGRVTGLAKDRTSVFVSVGSDDGVTKGMKLIIYKSNGTYIGEAQVYSVSANQSAARIIEPVVGTVAEGDNVTNK